LELRRAGYRVDNENVGPAVSSALRLRAGRASIRLSGGTRAAVGEAGGKERSSFKLPGVAIMTVLELNPVLTRIDLPTRKEEKLDVTEELIQQISRLNGYLNPAEVLNAFGNGYTVHTESTHYKLA
jgi:hypothetical protein